MGDIKNLRIEKGLTQQQVADCDGISLRSYKTYENDPQKEGSLKYNYILSTLQSMNVIDEGNGVLEVDDIIEKTHKIFENYSINYCILFGSYAKGKTTELSDVDLLISSDVKGIRYFGLVEELRKTLCEKIDALTIEQLNNNSELTDEILHYRIRIYS